MRRYLLSRIFTNPEVPIMGTKLTEVFQNVAKEGVDRCVYRSEVTKHRHGSVFETTETYRTEPNRLGQRIKHDKLYALVPTST